MSIKTMKIELYETKIEQYQYFIPDKIKLLCDNWNYSLDATPDHIAVSNSP